MVILDSGLLSVPPCTFLWELNN